MTIKALLCIALGLFLAVCALGQTSNSETELRALLNEFLAGAGRNDAAIHEKFWADDLIYTRSAGVRIDKPELIRGVRLAPPAKPDDPVTTYAAEDLQIRTYGSTAVVAFRLIGKTVKKDGVVDTSEFLNTGTFVQRKGRWQAVAWQATAVPKARVESTVSAPTPTAAAAKPVKIAGRTYIKGPKGGCYYLTASGKKTYVNKELCT